LLVCGKLENH